MSGNVSTAELDDALDALKAAIRGDAPHSAELLAQLRTLNGVHTTGLLTPWVYSVARKRLHQGYTLREVAWMTGLARSTVGNIKRGHRRARQTPGDAAESGHLSA